MELDATFWAFIALLIFIGVLVYVKVPGQIAKALDNRADKIRNELEEARRLRDEAKELLAEYQRRRKEAEAEANQIVTAAAPRGGPSGAGSQGQDRGIRHPPHGDGRAEDRAGRSPGNFRGQGFRSRPRDCRVREADCGKVHRQDCRGARRQLDR